jgi:hypothetical protein
MALGRGRLAPIAAHASVYWLLDRAFIGLPCPKKTAGIKRDMFSSSLYSLKGAPLALSPLGISNEN